MKIESTADFLGLVQKLQAQHTDEFLYFRGESQDNWEMRPSVMRNGLVQFETEMLTQLIIQRPDDFAAERLAISQWVLAQHHGLKTRFLDVTRNPLVALFHACNDSSGNAAKLHLFSVRRELIKPFDSDTVSIIANFAKLTFREQDMLLSTLPSSDITEYTNTLYRLYQLINREKPYFEERIIVGDLFRIFVIEPQQTSERIRAQSGAFLASAFHRRFEREEILRHNGRIPVYAHYAPTIPAESKEAILKELRLMNMTRETPFPSLDESARAITESYLQRLQDAEGTATDTG